MRSSSWSATRSLAVAGLALCTVAASRPAVAQSAADLDRARELFREAAALAASGDWEGSRDRYEQSLAIKRSALSLYGLAVAEQQTGRLVEALRSYREFLAEPSTPSSQPWEQPAREAIATIEKRVARLSITVKPEGVPGLGLRIDGEAVPAAGWVQPRLVNPGVHEVIASAPGHEEARHVAVVREGGESTVALALRPIAGGGPARPAATPADTSGSSPPILPYALVGGGALALAIAVPVGVVGLGEAGDAPSNDSPEADSARTKGLVADVLGGAGIVAIGVGVVLLLLRGGDEPAAPARAAARPWISGSKAGLEVRF